MIEPRRWLINDDRTKHGSNGGHLALVFTFGGKLKVVIHKYVYVIFIHDRKIYDLKL